MKVVDIVAPLQALEPGRHTGKESVSIITWLKRLFTRKSESGKQAPVKCVKWEDGSKYYGTLLNGRMHGQVTRQYSSTYRQSKQKRTP